jgi:lipoprotein-anchoring transpeptidase ErfK/SrfK
MTVAPPKAPLPVPVPSRPLLADSVAVEAAGERNPGAGTALDVGPQPDLEVVSAQPDLEPSAEEAAQSEPQYVEPSLTSVARETMIYERPSASSQKIGYLRVGAVVTRSQQPVGNDGCKRGWYRVRPDGYVCLEQAALLDTEGLSAYSELARVRPDRMAPLPYAYGRSRFPAPPFYSRLPSKAEQERTELDMVGHLRARTAAAWTWLPTSPTPSALADGRPVPMPWGYHREGAPLTTGRAMPDSGFAILGVYERDGRRFALNTDFQLVPLDRLTPVEVSSFHGVRLDDAVTLPLAFVRSRNALLYAGDPKTGLSIARRLSYREPVQLTGREIVVAGVHYLETKAHDYIRNEKLARIEPMKSRPGWATPGRSWIHVSILQQSLVMYSGDQPVYATLVSTGKDGLGEPLETHSTIRGQFLVHTKHVSVTMDSDAEGEEFDLRDVPYVQYFQGGYALHAAFWHDSFGQPYSHGCVNLSPLDARALFHMTDPPVPQSWHGAMSLRGGTLIHITP